MEHCPLDISTLKFLIKVLCFYYNTVLHHWKYCLFLRKYFLIQPGLAPSSIPGNVGEIILTFNFPPSEVSGWDNIFCYKYVWEIVFAFNLDWSPVPPFQIVPILILFNLVREIVFIHCFWSVENWNLCLSELKSAQNHKKSLRTWVMVQVLYVITIFFWFPLVENYSLQNLWKMTSNLWSHEKHCKKVCMNCIASLYSRITRFFSRCWKYNFEASG